MIRINLLDYREELERVAVQKKTVASLCVISGFILLIVVVWIQKQGQIITVQEEAVGVQEKVNALESQVRVIRKMKVRKRRADQIIEGIEKLRKEQTSPSELLENLSEKIPKDLWLDAIRQVDKKFLKKKNIQIVFEDGSKEIIMVEGTALKESVILEYSQNLQRVEYFKSVIMYKIEKTFLLGSSVWKFTILGHKKAGPNDKPEKKKKK
jgi:Tfp pilus assembly protein PilN